MNDDDDNKFEGVPDWHFVALMLLAIAFWVIVGLLLIKSYCHG